MSALDSVLLIGFGGPTRPDEVLPFLRNVVRGRNVPPERLAEVAHHYELLGGRSPYNELAFRQARALEARLRPELPLPVFVGMRNWHPLLRETIAALHAAGHRRTAGIILATHRSSTSLERYRLDVARAVEECGAGPEVEYVAPWFEDPLFLEANAERIREAAACPLGDWPAEVPLLFTAHSIPAAMARESPYEADLLASCRGVATLLGAGTWRLVYQSRSGDGRTPWLEPDILEALDEAAAAGSREVVVQPIGFLHDHVEVLYDLDVEARRRAEELGLRMRRAATVGDHPRFIELLARRVLSLAGRP